MDTHALALALDALNTAGFARVDVPVLLGMDDFLQISGEEFRRRIFVTSDNRGHDYCLRPEFTIPVCRQAQAQGLTEGRFVYSGKVFLNGLDHEPQEIWQLGAEIIGLTNGVESDVEALRLALEACAPFGLTAPHVRTGDIGLFRALLESLNVPPAWARRLIHQFGNKAKVLRTLEHMGQASDAQASLREHSDVVAALSQFPAETVGRLFSEVLAIAGVKTMEVGGRSAAEIAERVVEQATLAAQGILPDHHAALIRVLLEIHGPAQGAAAALQDLAERVDDGSFGDAVHHYQNRLAALTSAGIDLSHVEFTGHFGRELGYYDGFVFDVLSAKGETLAGGGRYDATASRLLGHVDMRGIGFAVMPDRFEEMTP